MIAGPFTDEELRQIVIDAETVDVKVRDGVVTLAGTVPDMRAYNAALDAAKYTPGVVDVINHLTIG